MKGKIDLHLHLDGSLDLECSWKLAKERGIVDMNCTLEQFSSQMIVPSDNPSLHEYLSCFDLPISILQDHDAIAESVYALIRNLHEQGLIYAEIRFAPQNHTKKGLSQAEVVEAALAGRKKASQDFPEVKTNFILCMMIFGEEEVNHNENKETVYVAKEFLNKGVVAIDIAGSEGSSPLIGYKPLFDLAKKLGLVYTIHAGEAGPASNVETAILMGASRIGHGGHCTLDPKVKQMVIDKQIPLEMCPTSNVHCCCQPSFEEHALIELYHDGALVTLNTDNMTLSRVNLEKEVNHVLNEMKMTEEDMLQLTKNSIQAAFLSDAEKQELLAKL